MNNSTIDKKKPNRERKVKSFSLAEETVLKLNELRKSGINASKLLDILIDEFYNNKLK